MRLPAGRSAITVIVPAFNAAPYVERSIGSLLAQTARELSVIAVDDGSTDATAEVLGALARAHPGRVTVAPALRSNGKPLNQGLAAARNRGLAMTRTEWVGFVDADDWVEPSMFELLGDAAARRGADLAICTGQLVNDKTGESRPFQDHAMWKRLCAEHPGLVDCYRTPELFLTDTSSCRRLYRTELLRGLGFQFAHGRLFEDVLANYQLLLSTRAVALVDADVYRYRTHHPGRITDRTDAQLLDGAWVLQQSAAALARAGATPAMWACFLGFQSWVVRWLGTSIEAASRRRFAEEACAVAGAAPPTGAAEFFRRHAEQPHTVELVERQLAGPAALEAAFGAPAPAPRARLSFFLPIARSDTGRPGDDLARLSLCLASWTRCFPPEALGNFLIAAPPRDVASVAERVRSLVGEQVTVVSELELAPELAEDPETSHPFPAVNKGWLRQQVLKLAAAARMTSRFYMTLDADVVFTRPFTPDELIRDGRGLVNTQTAADFAQLWTPEVVEASVQERNGRARAVAQLLGLEPGAALVDRFFGETPVVLSRAVVGALTRRLDALSPRGWKRSLFEARGWTEYTLYFTWAVASGLFDELHEAGGPNAVLRLADSLWYPREWTLEGRDPGNWQPLAHEAARGGVAVVAQSWLGDPAEAVSAAIERARRPA